MEDTMMRILISAGCLSLAAWLGAVAINLINFVDKLWRS